MISYKTLDNNNVFPEVFHNTSDPVLITSTTGSICYVNNAWEKLTGYTYEEVFGKNSSLIQSGTSDTELYEKIWNALKESQSYTTGELIHHSKDGKKYQIHSTFYPIMLLGGMTFYVQILHDISKHIEYQDTVKSLNQRISIILDDFGHGLFCLDRDWNFIYINKEAESLLNTSRDNILGKNLWQMFPMVIDTETERNYRLSMQDQRKIDFKIPGASGKIYNIRCYPSTDGLSVYFTDITLEDSYLNRQQDFISIASHELKTPLTSLSANMQVMNKYFADNKDSEELNVLKNMALQIEKLKLLTSDLLDMSAIQTNNMHLYPSMFDLNKLVQEVIENNQTISMEHKMRLYGHITSDIYADSLKVSQVITNLLNNAARYSPDNTDIHLILTEYKDYVVVSVQDFGVGILPDFQDKIFERYYRTSESKKSAKDLGIGLFISNNIVKAHNGKMWLESEEGKGTTFYFSLPLHKNRK